VPYRLGTPIAFTQTVLDSAICGYSKPAHKVRRVKKKVLRKYKVSMSSSSSSSSPLAVCSPQPEIVIPERQYRSYLGRILAFYIESWLNPPKSILARVLRDATQAPTPTFVSLVLDCTARTYLTYAAYCKVIGVEPRPIRYWNELRKLRVTATQVEALLKDFKYDHPRRQYFMQWDVVGVKEKGLFKETIFKRLVPVPCVDTFPIPVHGRCKECGAPFTTKKGKPALRVSAFCEANCRRAWLAKEQAANKRWSSEHHVALLARPMDRPTTYDSYLARAAMCPSLPKQVEKKLGFGSKDGVLTITPEFAHRTPYEPGAVKPSKSLWCEQCGKYTEQCHACEPVNAEQRLEQARKDFYLKMASPAPLHHEHYVKYTILRSKCTTRPQLLELLAKPEALRYVELLGACATARQLEVLGAKEREQEIRQRVAAYEKLNAAGKAHHQAVFMHSVRQQLTYQWVRRLTSIADRIVVCDLREINSRVPPITPALPVAKRLRCKHSNKRTFTFSTGEVVSSCPDCTRFDTKRAKTLKVENIVKASPGALALWKADLDAVGLSMSKGSFHKSLCWGDLDDLATSEDAAAEGSQAVNTAGSVGTDREGEDIDSSSHDRRAKGIRKKQNARTSLIKSRCWQCGADIWSKQVRSKDGGHFCPGSNHRQLFQKEKLEIRVDLEYLKLGKLLQLQAQLEKQSNGGDKQ
jgi:hypothetical protein